MHERVLRAYFYALSPAERHRRIDRFPWKYVNDASRYAEFPCCRAKNGNIHGSGGAGGRYNTDRGFRKYLKRNDMSWENKMIREEVWSRFRSLRKSRLRDKGMSCESGAVFARDELKHLKLVIKVGSRRCETG